MKNRDYSRVYRIMHWAIAFCMLFIMLTVFLRLTWMNKNNVSDIIQEFLSSNDQSMPVDDSVVLAKKIRKPMFVWHIYTGYVLVGLYALRLILPLFGEMKFPNPFKSGLSFKEKFQCWVYLIFYVGLTGSLFTGMMIEFGPDSVHELMEEIHVLSIYYVIAFMILHFAGVLIAEFTDENGIISRVISGKRTLK